MHLPRSAARRVKWSLRATRLGLLAERVTRAFWPFWSVVLVVLSGLMFGIQDIAPLELVWGAGVLTVIVGLACLVWAVRRFEWPTADDAMDRLDRSLPGRPITAISDTQVIGAGDAASEGVWQAHVARMAKRVETVRPVEPDLRLSARDPYALRYVATIAFVMALIFGSVLRIASVSELGTGPGSALAAGPSWEGWIEPPAYTGRPSIYLADVDQEYLAAAVGSRVTIRLYGEIGALSVAETVSARTGEVPPATDVAQSFEITQSGQLSIDGPGGQSWSINVITDQPPAITFDGAAERGVSGELRQPFFARDDYGVVGGRAEIALALDEIDREYGLAIDPEPRDPIVFDLPMSITGDRRAFGETLIEDLSRHPWAGLPVEMTLSVEDAIGQKGTAVSEQMTLPGRRFFDPLAQAIIEQRRDLLWSRQNAARVAQVLRAVSNRPEDIFRSETAFLKLRVAIRRLETNVAYSVLSTELQQETADVLWDIALLIEEGDLSDALERLRRAQDRLSDAIENGATDEEIAELMDELREAMQDYMRQLAEQSRDQDQQQAENQQNMQEITGDQLQDMLDRLQELMEQGRTAEAQQLLDQLRQMMENMQVTQGQQGQGQQSPGQQAMEGLADTLRQQQGLSDEAFRDLQEQFNPGAQAGQSGENEGRSGGEGRGESHDGTGGEGQAQGDGQRPGEGDPGDLADRQQALREQLRRQQESLPGAGTPEGDAARDALGRAGRAMDGAEEALRQDDYAGALDDQAEAMDALREGMRELGEAMAQQQQQQGQQGDAIGRNDPRGQVDPLGRDSGQNGRIGTDEQLLQGDDVYRRARELLDEIRRRSADQARPADELDYLRRLLDRF